MKQKNGLCALLLALLCILGGCGQKEDHAVQLWIVTEQTTWDRMNGQTGVLIETFEEENPGVTIRLDILPLDQQERSVYLQQLRTEILRGGGPDGYLLPTDNLRILDEPAQYTYVEAEPLFVDAELAMRNGLFYDITNLYDADDSLGKEGLNTKIMDAGVVDGKRYILPLRYDMPVIYAENAALEAAGLDTDILHEDILTIMEAVLATGDPILAGGILHDSFSAFSNFIDYASGNAELDEVTLSRYLQVYQQLKELVAAPYLDGTRLSDDEIEAIAAEDSILLKKLDVKEYIYGEYGEPEPVPGIPDNVIIIGGKQIEEEGLDVYTEYYPLYIGTMADSFSYAAVAAYEDAALTMVPMRSIGGNVVATVTYYAAVGSGSQNPELTYEFLRQFLLEESQWEQNRPQRKHTYPFKDTPDNDSNDLQYPGLIGNGWPVRDQNTVETLWEVRRKQIYVKQLDYFFTSDGTRLRMRKIGLSGMTEAQIPLFDTPINQVRFNTTLSEELAQTLTSLTDPASAAERLCWNLRWHVSEG